MQEEELLFGLFFGCVLLMPVWMLILSLAVGGYVERAHLRSLEQREAMLSGMLVTQIKTFPMASQSSAPPALFIGEAVISSDHLKTWLTNLRKIFGGEMGNMRRICDRARREALVRLLEQAHQAGYNAVCNVRLDTADISGSMSPQKRLMSTIMASGTAYHADYVPSKPTPPLIGIA